MEIPISTFLKDFLKEKVPMLHLKWFRDFLSKSKISKFWWFFRDRNNICNGSIRSTPTWKPIFRGSDMQISILPGSSKSVSVTHYPLSVHDDSVIRRKIFFLVPTINPWTGSVPIFRARKLVTGISSSAPKAQCFVTTWHSQNQLREGAVVLRKSDWSRENNNFGGFAAKIDS